MLQLVYCSLATHPFSDHDLDGLLAQSRAVNGIRGITGLLVYEDGAFFQVLEGPDDEVVDVMERIERDRRHGCVNVMSRTAIRRREFGDWNMALARAETNVGEAVEFRVDFSMASSQTIKLLYMFQEGALRPPEKLAEVTEQVSVTIAPASHVHNRQAAQSAYLVEFARAIALSMPDVAVKAAVGADGPISFNVRKAVDGGSVELF
ncbi:MAG TPA: BLUF domain-containing protein [Candidatus Omnitrophota bacterium]|nr:BLUF domain-containing protein [Candidatus Omnitrophota bacterium]